MEVKLNCEDIFYITPFANPEYTGRLEIDCDEKGVNCISITGNSHQLRQLVQHLLDLADKVEPEKLPQPKDGGTVFDEGGAPIGILR